MDYYKLTPLFQEHYNVLDISRDHRLIRVHTRCLRRHGGAWEGWAVWHDSTNRRARLTSYDIMLTP